MHHLYGLRTYQLTVSLVRLLITVAQMEIRFFFIIFYYNDKCNQKWFDEPFKFRNFTDYFPDMLTEDALEEVMESYKKDKSKDESD